MTPEERDKLMARIRAAKHLPKCLRDFHDQKDVFKSVHDVMSKHSPETCEKVNWIEGQCYSIDVFLKFMALHGYELRKSRSRPTYDLNQTIQERQDREAEVFKAALAQVNLGPVHPGEETKNHEDCSH